MENINTITVEVKTAWGNKIIEPACDRARIFTRLTRNKNLTMDDVELIKQLGFTVLVKQTNPPTL